MAARTATNPPSRDAARTAAARRGAFTLLEMLIVIAVIVALAGMVFRMVAMIGKSNDISATRAKLEKTAAALEEFKALYGKYPPVYNYDGEGQPVRYEYPVESTWGWGADGESAANEVCRSDKSGPVQWKEGENHIFTFGLCSFFVPRYNGTAERGPARFLGGGQRYSEGVSQWRNYNSKDGDEDQAEVGDSERDLNAIRRILPNLEAKLGPDGRIEKNGILTFWECTSKIDIPGVSRHSVTNIQATIVDAWDRNIRYSSRPPYETYRLWSVGPDGKNGTRDDIYAGQN